MLGYYLPSAGTKKNYKLGLSKPIKVSYSTLQWIKRTNNVGLKKNNRWVCPLLTQICWVILNPALGQRGQTEPLV